jgi:hypothetical protein
MYRIIQPSLEETTSLWGFISSCSLYMQLDHLYFIVMLNWLVIFFFLRPDLRHHMRNHYFTIRGS